MRRLGVVEQFAVRSLGFIVIMAVVLGVIISVSVRSLFISETAKTARVTANAIVVDHVRDEDLSVSVLSPELTRELDRMAFESLAGAGITTIKLWNPDGVLLYSSDGEKVGESFADHPSVASALAGIETVEIPTQVDDENEAQFTRDGRVIEVYAPLTIAGKTVGVFEIYKLYAPVSTAINRFLVLMWLVIIGGSVPAYFLQLRLVRRTANELTAAKGDLAEVNERLGASLEDIELHSLGTLQAFVAAVDAKDSYTARHSIAVTDYATAIARRMGLSSEDVSDVERAGLLHDVGKIGTPESILLKSGRLTDEECHVINEHSGVGGHIIEGVPFLSHLMPVIRAHHERWDGGGYPDGLAGEDIPVLARVLTVADAFDAMTSERPYRKPVTVEAARAELLRFSGTQFDPRVVAALLAALDAEEVKVLVHVGHARANRRRVAASA